jgi:hypothetical protein
MHVRAILNAQLPRPQALMFMAGANSIFNGDKLLTTANPEFNADTAVRTRVCPPRCPVQLIVGCSCFARAAAASHGNTSPATALL